MEWSEFRSFESDLPLKLLSLSPLIKSFCVSAVDSELSLTFTTRLPCFKYFVADSCLSAILKSLEVFVLLNSGCFTSFFEFDDIMFPNGFVSYFLQAVAVRFQYKEDYEL